MLLDTTGLKYRMKFKDGTEWYEFTKTICPICGKTGFCIINHTATIVGCTRVPSKRLLIKDNNTYRHDLDANGQVIEFKGQLTSRAANGLEKMPPHILDFIFRRMLTDESMRLIAKHKALLYARGMSEETMNVRGYISGAEKPWVAAESILMDLGARIEKTRIGGVPGFYKGKYGWTMKRANGFLIPFRDEHNVIKGFQIRNDNPPNRVSIKDAHMFPTLQVKLEQPNHVTVVSKETGEILLKKDMEIDQEEMVQVHNQTALIKLKSGLRYVWLSSSGENLGTGAGGEEQPLPYHISVPTPKLKKNNELYQQSINDKANEHYVNIQENAIWVTEGPLKADLASDHIAQAFKNEIATVGDTVVAIPGVNNWRMVLPLLKKMGVKRVNLAFDMDAISNKTVFDQLQAFKIALKEELAIEEVYIALWKIEYGKGIDDCLANRVRPVLREMK